MSLITIPEILEQKLTHDGAEALVMLFNSFEKSAKDDILKASEDKFARLVIEAISGLRSEFKEDIANLRSELKEDNANLRAEFKEDIANLKTEIAKSEARLETKIADVKTDLIKWFVGAAIAQIAIILSVLSFVIK